MNVSNEISIVFPSFRNSVIILMKADLNLFKSNSIRSDCAIVFIEIVVRVLLNILTKEFQEWHWVSL